MTKLIFVENQLQAMEAGKLNKSDSDSILVALTAEAVCALESMNLNHKPVFEFADTRLLASAERQYTEDCLKLLTEIESFFTTKYPPLESEAPGFLTGQIYHMQYSIGAIAARAFLMHEAIRLFSPSSVTVFQGRVDPWFSGDSYTVDPWYEALMAMSDEFGFDLQNIVLKKSEQRSNYLKLKDYYYYFRSNLLELVKDSLMYLRDVSANKKIKENAHRLLFADAQGYDWHPVLGSLRRNKNYSLYFLKSESLSDKIWSYLYSPILYNNYLWSRRKVNCQSFTYDKDECEFLQLLLDEWVAVHPQKASLKILGIDLFPALLPHLRAKIPVSVSVARYTMELAGKVLDLVQPDALCFFAMPWLSAKILAFQARQRGIPVISYQHGGAYGTQVVPRHDFADYFCADYFLTYGEGVKPPEDPINPTRAKFVPVGSSRLEKIIDNRNNSIQRSANLKVLWIAEYSTRNTYGTESLVEDTLRYHLQTACLQILGDHFMHVVYRPYSVGPELATSQWIRQAGYDSIRVDTINNLEKLIMESDVVVCDASSSTTWNEVIAMGRPLILYCDPGQTVLMPHFIKDLEQVCCWCKSMGDLVLAVNHLAKNPKDFMQKLSERPVDGYLKKYVLHERDSVEHVIAFLSALCGHKRHVSMN